MKVSYFLHTFGQDWIASPISTVLPVVTCLSVCCHLHQAFMLSLIAPACRMYRSFFVGIVMLLGW